jgi:regulator of nucleoside diphosphate kinase
MTARPNLILSSLDVERLERLIDSMAHKRTPAVDALEEELVRDEVVAPQDVPPTVVTMNSTVRFDVEHTGESFCMTLVYPKDVDDKCDKISVLSPVGSALLGLSQGESIDWIKPGGGTLQVRIKEVVYQPERAGELHR